jgi:hypothetical protein
MIETMRKDLKEREAKNLRHVQLTKSARTPANDNSKSKGKRDLLQYRLFDNDSDEDCFEGLGNTTIDRKGNIAAGLSSDEECQGLDNNQSGAGTGAEEVDKNIIEIAVESQNRSM